jgi:hypothetical protein
MSPTPGLRPGVLDITRLLGRPFDPNGFKERDADDDALRRPFPKACWEASP